MTSAAVNQTMRSHGWNIEFLTTPHDIPFAGVFQPANRVFMTFRDIINEMRLSFEFPDEASDFWDGLSFQLLDMLNVSQSICPAPEFMSGRELDQPVPALPELDTDRPEDRVILRYRVFKHDNCSLEAAQPFKSHVQAGCAKRITKPTRRLEPRYLPPKVASTDPRYATYPLRKKARGRRAASPSKRSASGSASPNKDADLDQADEELANLVAPPQCNISDERAKTTMANFRNSCLTSAKHCAITGMGRSWCHNPTIGPALQACHLVPQLHYHTYPDPDDDGDEAQDSAERTSPRRLEQAWERTWASENSILLFSHLHELFDQRLFSIHPETLQIRVFMPYDILLPYHGCKAKVQRRIDRAALRHHYEMCCIENMAAKLPFTEQVPQAGSLASTSGVHTPLELRPALRGVASPGILELPSTQKQDRGERPANGDPTKRAKQSERQDTPDLMSDGTVSATPSSDRFMDDSTAPLNVSWSHKRKRGQDENVAIRHDSYIAPCNGESFLADVNWELRKFIRRRK
ncbi:hypothetical protein F66182_2580 [Fusarium sp. NRRL 66182]|nr:hypothetical protein F66182_2580 [Fusarium sp. NRRL 66182]